MGGMTAESILRVVPASENHSRGSLWWRGRRYPCALGKGGVLPAGRKCEADGASPAGLYPLLTLYYRPDRMGRDRAAPETGLPTLAIGRNLGWCDTPACRDYNSAVDLPHSDSAESLWRADGLYDLLVVMGHNQNPAIPGRGSAIFLHVARDDYLPTRGCVALAREVLSEILPELDDRTMIRIYRP
jgi:L,D-peptidoglycan transpeptidase YkuD (ErfK/YbiS/YcfS/YnhG family)